MVQGTVLVVAPQEGCGSSPVANCSPFSVDFGFITRGVFLVRRFVLLKGMTVSSAPTKPSYKVSG